MAEVLLERVFAVRGLDFDKAGDISAEVKSVLSEIGMDPEIIFRVGVVTFEAEMNVVMYAFRGIVRLTLTEEDVSIEVSDKGPGIPDLELAMQEGFSTASDEMREMGFGYGMGLPNMKKTSDHFTLESRVGEGTRVVSLIRLNGP